MPKPVFITYAGRTVRAKLEDDSLAGLEAQFVGQFPAAKTSFVFYTQDPVRSAALLRVPLLSQRA